MRIYLHVNIIKFIISFNIPHIVGRHWRPVHIYTRIELGHFCQGNIVFTFRLWGDHGQTSLETARICLINASATGTEVLKNLILPGLVTLIIWIFFLTRYSLYNIILTLSLIHTRFYDPIHSLIDRHFYSLEWLIPISL